ncbi:MAG: glycosyltransferase [Anaerolineae bacterium]|nr:glycosyltransferase [Anaerolineae bacterium]
MKRVHEHRRAATDGVDDADHEGIDDGAALAIADSGYDVHLVERTEMLGGNLLNLSYVAEGYDPQRLLRDLVNRVRAHRRIAVHTRTEVVRRLGIPPARVRAVPLAAGPAFRPVEDAGTIGQVRSRYGLPERYFLYLGGFDQRKNLDTLFRAVAEARQREPGLPLLAVAGALPARDTPLMPDPRRLAREAGLEGGVSFLGRVAEEDKPPLYAGAVAFLFPSRYEGFGLPALEALACGAPVVSACATSLPEVVGEAGLLVGPDDVPGWAEAMVQLARSEELRTRLRTLGPAQAERFSWERTARETAIAYRMVALGSIEPTE